MDTKTSSICLKELYPKGYRAKVQHNGLCLRVTILDIDEEKGLVILEFDQSVLIFHEGEPVFMTMTKVLSLPYNLVEPVFTKNA